MSRFYAHINSAQMVIDTYGGQEPLANFLKKFFAQNKKYGSTDRRSISSLCYCYYRAAKALPNMPLQEKLLAATLLCNQKPSTILQALKPEWNALIEAPIATKTGALAGQFFIENIFTYQQELSAEINAAAYSLSFLKQPKTFIRIRPGYEDLVPAKLKASALDFEKITPTCLALPSGQKIEECIVLNKEGVVQDYGSQKISELIIPFFTTPLSSINVLDCCAGSGGKSIMAFDINPTIHLTVCDVRPTILHNLAQRFKTAGIANYTRLQADVSSKQMALSKQKKFEIIIADVPCTGSGTWSRTPEQLFFFDKNTIGAYADKQKKIVNNVLPHLGKAGVLVYITCSVFAKENEEVVGYLQKQQGLKLILMKTLAGYHQAADSMFVAILKRE